MRTVRPQGRTFRITQTVFVNVDRPSQGAKPNISPDSTAFDAERQ